MNSLKVSDWPSQLIIVCFIMQLTVAISLLVDRIASAMKSFGSFALHWSVERANQQSRSQSPELCQEIEFPLLAPQKSG